MVLEGLPLLAFDSRFSPAIFNVAHPNIFDADFVVATVNELIEEEEEENEAENPADTTEDMNATQNTSNPMPRGNINTPISSRRMNAPLSASRPHRMVPALQASQVSLVRVPPVAVDAADNSDPSGESDDEAKTQEDSFEIRGPEQESAFSLNHNVDDMENVAQEHSNSPQRAPTSQKDFTFDIPSAPRELGDSDGEWDEVIPSSQKPYVPRLELHQRDHAGVHVQATQRRFQDDESEVDGTPAAAFLRKKRTRL